MVREKGEVFKGKEVEEKLLEGAETIAEAVGTTFGPYGKFVAIGKVLNDAHITKDGVTVANAIKLRDPIADIAVQTIRQAASKTADEAGDGTTSTTLLSAELVSIGMEYLKNNPGITTRAFQTALQEDSKKAIKTLKALTEISAKDSKSIIDKVAYVASNGDEEITEIVTNAYNTIGVDGIVNVYESNAHDTKVEVTDGVSLSSTHASPALSRGKLEVTEKDVTIMVTDVDIKGYDMVHIMEMQVKSGKPMLIVCNDVDEQAQSILLHNKEVQNIPVDIVRAPHIAEARREILRDVALVSGATFLSKEQGYTIEDLNTDMLGTADAYTISRKSTVIVGRHGNAEAIKAKVEDYRIKIKEDTEGIATNYKIRLAVLSAGVAIINVGGATRAEVREKKDRFDDTVLAVRSALLSGCITGGTYAYYQMADVLMEGILKEGLLKLTKKLVGDQDPEEFFESIKGKIYDPVAVIENTVINAISAAMMIINTKCVFIKDES